MIFIIVDLFEGGEGSVGATLGQMSTYMTAASKSGNMLLRLAMHGSESALRSTLIVSGWDSCAEGGESVIMMG